ncbi:TonB-dependent receptor plug domain-containing protein [Lewinella sp. W8]|uniref:TonB-dependent receptor plug domain-containing protein n=1 Tax=Lewinella sp. W8 TaxID=2528208 RepID=UPI001068D192|nr:TonB-dependent receptor plug domain-containing protein [Lewinella sp. W8]MTB52469.1 TonB-dependent receptor plug domain-containing protein [Lewinella sp. W8]
MKKSLFGGYVLLLMLTLACAGTRTGTVAGDNFNENEVTSESVTNPVDLTDFLERVSGVTVRGNGANAEIKIRGPISFNGQQKPLFVVNGIKQGYEYANIYNAVNPRDIRRVRVLKNPSETAMYGVQAAAGVIEIYLKEKEDSSK